MAFDQMLAPCGIECSHCIHFLAIKNPTAMKQIEQWAAIIDIPIESLTCNGCRHQSGRIPLQMHLFGDNHYCSLFSCAQEKKVDYCGLCVHFPCNNCHPYTENYELLDENIKALLGIE